MVKKAQEKTASTRKAPTAKTGSRPTSAQPTQRQQGSGGQVTSASGGALPAQASQGVTTERVLEEVMEHRSGEPVGAGGSGGTKTGKGGQPGTGPGSGDDPSGNRRRLVSRLTIETFIE